ncbi:amino acid ABC transporter permease [Trinickia mobilis]|uniref:amino acid ABC transporter permease n=1 Tax=Trinickia mobilis TaxID=2816356 RepID=UPI001A8E1F4A|nr:amino acid ABC transporter permease [Trinickia mobilis]
MIEILTAHGALKPLFDGLLQGAGTTLYTSCVAFLLGLAFGVMLLAVRVGTGRVGSALVMLYVSAIRGTPLLIQLLIAYYVLPTLIGLSITPAAAGILALSLNTAAYICEILRGALGTIPDGQRAAASALGMRTLQIWRYVLLPQVFYRAVPPLTSEFTVLLKASSLLSIIAVTELATVARNATLQSDLPLQVFAATAVVYFIILFCASSVSRMFERRISRVLPNVH